MARILVAESSPRIRASLKEILERAGHRVDTARDGREAVFLHRKHPADLLLVDLVMPEKDGLETIMELKRELPNPRIVAMCGGSRFPAEVGIRAALALGAALGLKKPVTPARMLRAVFELLGTLPVLLSPPIRDAKRTFPPGATTGT